MRLGPRRRGTTGWFYHYAARAGRRTSAAKAQQSESNDALLVLLSPFLALGVVATVAVIGFLLLGATLVYGPVVLVVLSAVLLSIAYARSVHD